MIQSPAALGCDAPCVSNHSETCGGDNAMNVFEFRCIGPPTPGRPAAPPRLGAVRLVPALGLYPTVASGKQPCTDFVSEASRN